MDPNKPIIYSIDGNDQIASFNRAWTHFAVESGAAQELSSSRITGRRLWDYISDERAIYLYSRLVSRVRKGFPVRFLLRGDAPSLRRLVEMRIRKSSHGGVIFTSRLISVSERPKAYSSTSESMGKRLIACSWCNRVEDSSDQWMEIERTRSAADAAETGVLPTLTYTTCDQCYRLIQSLL